MKVLVCGGRKCPRDIVIRWLGFLFNPHYPSDKEGKAGTWLPRPDLIIIEGGAKGADSWAYEWCVVNWVQVKEYPADWNKHGKAAGIIRNSEMLEKEPDIDLIVAFPGGRGTADMVGKARQKGIAILEIQKDIDK